MFFLGVSAPRPEDMNLITPKSKKREMVQYWKHGESAEAKMTLAPEGHYVLHIEGEKYPFPGAPRGVLLFGGLSKLKHEVKNQVFNESWRKLDRGEPIHDYLKNTAFPSIFELAEKTKYDMVPAEKMVPAVKELYRSMTEAGMRGWRDILTFIFQEDDSYRMRLQWMVKFFPKFGKPKLEHFIKGLEMMEHAEVTEDMRDRVRLIKRVMLAILRDPQFKQTFDAFLAKTDWRKVLIKESDLYYLRAKYFKADYPEYEY